MKKFYVFYQTFIFTNVGEVALKSVNFDFMLLNVFKTAPITARRDDVMIVNEISEAVAIERAVDIRREYA